MVLSLGKATHYSPLTVSPLSTSPLSNEEGRVVMVVGVDPSYYKGELKWVP